MQKFTRPLTREVECHGSRLALTLDEKGISVRPVGSRRQPAEITWEKVLCQMTGTADVPAAVEALKKGEVSQSSAEEPSVETPVAEPIPSAERNSKATATESSSKAAKSAGVPAILARLEAWLSKHRRRYLEGLLPGASQADLDAAKTASGVPLPDGLQALLKWHNGQSDDFIGHFLEDWNLMSTSQIVEAKRELDQADHSQTGWQATWIPFLNDDADDYVCVDTSQPNAPVREFWQGKTDHPVVAPSFEAWLEKFVSDVEHGDYHEDSERGSFLHRGS